MKIAAMAAGAVGGYFGARMAAAGHDVFFIARGAHLEAIKKNGLKIESVHGDLHLPKSTSPTIRPRSARSISCCSRSSCGTPRRRPSCRAPAGRARHPPHHLAERRRQRRAHGADPGRRADHRRRRLYRHHHRCARRHQADQPIRQDALRPSWQDCRQARGREAASLRRCRQGGQDRCRYLRRYRARALGEIRLPHRHGRRDLGLALNHRPDRGRPGIARLLPQADGGGLRRRQGQGRGARSGLYRGAHGASCRARSSPA